MSIAELKAQYNKHKAEFDELVEEQNEMDLLHPEFDQARFNDLQQRINLKLTVTNAALYAWVAAIEAL